MATSSATSTANQVAYSKLQTCVRKGYGIQVDSFTRDGVAYKRYVIPYDKDGNPIRRSELQRALDPANAGLQSVNIQKINDLAQSILDPHRDVHDTSEAKSRQNAFFDERGVHFVKSDEADDEDSVSHQKQSLTTAHLSTYSEAFGGIKDGMTGDQKAVLDLEAKLGSKTVEGMTRDEIDGALNQIDKKFVRLFRQHLAAASPTTTLKQVYEQALQIYVNDAVKTFQVSLNPDVEADVTKLLYKTAHEKFEPGVTVSKETWLEENVDNLGDPKYATAVFQAIHEVGTKETDPEKHTQTTADHAYKALISKVNDCWLEAHRLTAIARVDVIDVPVDDSRAAPLLASTPSHTGIHGSTDPEPSTKTVEAKTALKCNLEEEQKEQIDELNRLVGYATQIESASQKIGNSLSLVPVLGALPSSWLGGYIGTDYASQEEATEAWSTAVKKVAENWTVPGFDTEEKNLLLYSAPVENFLRTKISELRKEVAEREEKINFAKKPTDFVSDLQQLKEERTRKIEARDKAYRGPFGSKSTLQAKVDELDAKITLKQNVLDQWKTPAGKIELLTSLLHHDVSSVTPQLKDFASLREKLGKTNYPLDLTKEEIAALQTWKIAIPSGTTIDSSDPTLLLSSLDSYLKDKIVEQFLPEIKTKIEDAVMDGDYNTWKSETKNSNFRTAIELLEDLSKPENVLDTSSITAKQRLFALKLAHESISPPETDPTVWKQKMLAKLKEEEFKAIHPELDRRAAELTSKNLKALESDPDYTNWDKKAAHYQKLHQYLRGLLPAQSLTKEALYAYLSLPEVPDTITDPAKKITFLIEQARANYVLCKLNETGMPTHDVSWKPTPKDFRDARAWLKDPVSSEPSPESRAIIIAGVLTQEMDKSNLISELDKVIRVIDLEELPELDGVDGYDPSKEDLLKVEAFLNGRSEEPLTISQIKTYKKMKKNTPPPTEKPLEKAAHYQKQIAAGLFKQVTEGVDVRGWNGTTEHFEEALSWLASTSHTEPSEDVKKALASIKNPDDRNNTFELVENRLNYALRPLTLESVAKPDNTDDYTPTSADYATVFQYINGDSSTDLTENQLRTFKQLQTDVPLTFNEKDRHYRINSKAGERILLTEVAGDPANVDTHVPTSADYTAVLNYINGVSDTALTDDQLRTFKQLQMGAPHAPKDKIKYYRENLTTAIQVISLESEVAPSNTDAYKPTQEDFQAVADYLRDSSRGPLTDNQLRTFKQLQTGAPHAPKDKIKHYPRILDTSLLENSEARLEVQRNHSGTNWATVWVNVKAEKDFNLSSVDPRTVKKGHFTSALTKLKTGLVLTPEEKHAVKTVYDILNSRIKPGDTDLIKGYIFAVLFLNYATSVSV
ncbi:hypothetical protein [Simkania negevensis]|uniref:Uncharacterized protein n=1 Tax=Simkania negevensis (strain ATCC VR-1471 / DSM 27360 / Z) TaxID=331113 RepID=F8L4X4_SIMNZ|nr:hypothetical protein [Simkania negevensis]CCB88994.1 hypothetical protein SNE_A11170 [Simkania negevensis Z]